MQEQGERHASTGTHEGRSPVIALVYGDDTIRAQLANGAMQGAHGDPIEGTEKPRVVHHHAGIIGQRPPDVASGRREDPDRVPGRRDRLHEGDQVARRTTRLGEGADEEQAPWAGATAFGATS